MKHVSLFALLSLCLLPTLSLAQESAPVVEGSAYVPPPGTPIEPSSSSPAQLEIRLSTIEDEMRILRGKNEESEFQIKKLTEMLNKMQRDTDMRFNDLTNAKAAPAAAPVKEPLALDSEAKMDKTAAPVALDDTAEKPAASKEKTLQLPPPVGATTSTSEDGDTPRGLYNAAFRLLNQTKYEEAAASFEKFTKKYPEDPLVGNAYYWAGETFYIRRDYVTAADHFRQGFEALPSGPKAPDNLLKLAMSLDALKRDKEACVVLQQIASKFKKGSQTVLEKAAAEEKRIGCK